MTDFHHWTWLSKHAAFPHPGIKPGTCNHTLMNKPFVCYYLHWGANTWPCVSCTSALVVKCRPKFDQVKGKMWSGLSLGRSHWSLHETKTIPFIWNHNHSDLTSKLLVSYGMSTSYLNFWSFCWSWFYIYRTQRLSMFLCQLSTGMWLLEHMCWIF